MSLSQPFKFFARLEKAGMECPEVVSMAQVLRVISLFVLFGLATLCFKMSMLTGSLFQ